jgi:ankyrin repeat protein
MVELLLKNGADPNIHSRHGRPLCWARERDLVERLISAGGDINLWHDMGGSPLNFGVWQLDPERIEIQLSLGADVHGCDPVSGDSVLHTLARTARRGWARDGEVVEKCLRLLIGAGAELARRNREGAAAFDIAESRGDEVLAGLLRGSVG